MSTGTLSSPLLPDTKWSRFNQSLPFLLFVLFLIGMYAGSPNFHLVDSPSADPYGGDVIQEWIGGYVIWFGESNRLFDQDYIKAIQHDRDVLGFSWNESGYFPTPYPPFYYLLVSPLSWLPLTVSIWVWAAFLVGCFLLSIYLWGRAEPESQTRLWILFPFLLFFLPVTESLLSSQKGTVLLAIVMGMYYSLKQRREYHAGMIAGLLLFKPHLILVPGLIMLFQRRWLFLLGMTTTGVVLAGLSVSVLGFDTCREWVMLVAGFGDYLNTPGYDYWKTHCWWGAFHLMLPHAPGWLVNGLTLSGMGLTLGLVILSFRGEWAPSSKNFRWQYSLMVIGMVLCSPHLYTYDCTLLVFPLLAMITLPQSNRNGMMVAVFVFALFGPAMEASKVSSLPITVLMMVGMIYTIIKQMESLSAVRPQLEIQSARLEKLN